MKKHLLASHRQEFTKKFNKLSDIKGNTRNNMDAKITKETYHSTTLLK